MVGAILYLAVSAVSAAIGWIVGGLNVSNRDEKRMAAHRSAAADYLIERDEARAQRDRLNRKNAELTVELKDARHQRDEAYVRIGEREAEILRLQRQLEQERNASIAVPAQEVEYEVNPPLDTRYEAPPAQETVYEVKTPRPRRAKAISGQSDGAAGEDGTR